MAAFDGIPFDTNLQFKIINGKKPECTHDPEFYVILVNSCMDNDPDKRLTDAIIVNKVGHWLDETNRDDDDIKNQILEAYKIKPEPVEPKNPKYYYSNKLINTNPIVSKLKS
ncbi:kinase-like domain-containing protein [Gigaspora margarita]|uniref:Kinase-like domain-containing protein n=1 Tax=Gigaspora margarita TaxID=4874 RepID=A0A8H4ERN2_GIGMA|nr:kinase-like domain-containing protein [Gigaspora margarita]